MLEKSRLRVLRLKKAQTSARENSSDSSSSSSFGALFYNAFSITVSVGRMIDKERMGKDIEGRVMA